MTVNNVVMPAFQLLLLNNCHFKHMYLSQPYLTQWVLVITCAIRLYLFMTERVKQCHDTTLISPKGRREENISRFEGFTQTSFIILTSQLISARKSRTCKQIFLLKCRFNCFPQCLLPFNFLWQVLQNLFSLLWSITEVLSQVCFQQQTPF